MSSKRNTLMTTNYRQSLRRLTAITLIGTFAGIAGCTTSPKSVPDTSQNSDGGAIKADSECGTDCSDEEGIGRYKYYLGVLSVLLTG